MRFLELAKERLRWCVYLLAIAMAACSVDAEQKPTMESVNTSAPSLTAAMPTNTVAFTTTLESTIVPVIETPIIENTPGAANLDGPIGLGLRQETASILLEHQQCYGLTMAASSEMADSYFPQLEGWIRVLGAPSLDELQNKGTKANASGLSYEGLGYGLETSQTTPEAEWKNLVKSTELARDLVDQYGKLLVMGPGFQLMSRNEDKYAPMAALADVWMLQTQQLQKNPPGDAYRNEVERLVGLIRSKNPEIKIWAQITLPPDRDPDAAEWLEYRRLIVDLVDGTYLGVYTWDRVDNELLISTIETIFDQVCGAN
jgi:hypothetical protein